jgi:hypothetical protein
MDFPIKISDEMKATIQTAYANNDMEAAIAALQHNGFSQMQTVFILISEINASFTEANQYVLNSKAWNS